MSDFKETCIWMSYRYAIGRKTIASVTHASDIAEHIDWIPEKRRDFTAFDIVREINQHLSWWSNIHVDGFEIQSNPYNIFDIILNWFLENPVDNPRDYFIEHEWYVNLPLGLVEVEERKELPQKSDYGYFEPNVFDDYHDFKDWIRLSKYLKGYTHIATVEYEGNTSEIEVIEMFDYSNYGGEFKLSKIYYKANEFKPWFTNPDYIKKITPKE